MIPSNYDELNLAAHECRKIATKRSIISAFSSGIPIPAQDIAVDVWILMNTLPKINDRFGLSVDQVDTYGEYSRVLVYEGIKEVGAKLAGRIITGEVILDVAKKLGVCMSTKQLARYVPIIGQVISALIAFGGMKYILNAHIHECYRVAEVGILRKGQEVTRFESN